MDLTEGMLKSSASVQEFENNTQALKVHPSVGPKYPKFQRKVSTILWVHKFTKSMSENFGESSVFDRHMVFFSICIQHIKGSTRPVTGKRGNSKKCKQSSNQNSVLDHNLCVPASGVGIILEELRFDQLWKLWSHGVYFIDASPGNCLFNVSWIRDKWEDRTKISVSQGFKLS